MRRTLLLLALVVTASCAGADATVTPAVPVSMPTASKDTVFTPGLNFSPRLLTVRSGATIVFALGFDGTGHDVKFADRTGSPAYIPVSVKKYVPVTFAAKGDFPYVCPTHPEMTGVITVQ